MTEGVSPMTHLRVKIFVAIVLIAIPALVIDNAFGRTLAGAGLLLSLALAVAVVDGSAKGDSRRETLLGLGLSTVYGSLFAGAFFRTEAFGPFFYLGGLMLIGAFVADWRASRRRSKVPDRPPLDDVI